MKNFLKKTIARSGRMIAIPILVVTALVFLRCSQETIMTPLEASSGEMLTSYEAMVSFLSHLNEKTHSFSQQTIATSVEGRAIPMLHFQDRQPGPANQSDNLTVLIYTQQHGDEPSGKEAALMLARDIATGKFSEFLQSIDLLLIPQVNPDGAETQIHGNARDVDLNKNHLTLTEPEVQGLHGVFLNYLPEVTLDVHESGLRNEAWEAAGMQKRFGVQMGTVSNLNMPIAIRGYVWSNVFRFMERELRARNMYFQRYLVAEDPAGRFRHGTTAINDGRNSMGIYNTFSFVQEGEGAEGMMLNTNIRERTRKQLETLKLFLTYLSQHAMEIKRIVQEQREELIRGSERLRIHITMDYVKDPANPSVTVPVRLLEQERIEDKTFQDYYPIVASSSSVVRPQGYAFPADQTGILEILERHRIAVHVSDQPTRAVLELYTVNSVTPTLIEDKKMFSVDVSVSGRIAMIPRGYYIVWCNQIQAAQLVIMLEPHSIWGLAQQPEFSSLLKVGSTYPVIRIMRTVQ